MFRVVFALAVCLFALPAAAADKLVMAPIPGWVKPLEIKAPPIDETDLPVRLLLHDRQLSFSPEGDSEFIEQVVQIRTPQGLSALGNLALAWNPDTDTITIHRARILRNGKPIDMLERQSFTVIRREANLERAIVDGVLTATLQPEGLQVGDLVDLAYTITHTDPVLQGRSERTVMLPSFVKADRMRLRATWDAARPLQWRANAGLEPPKVTTAGGKVELSVDLRDPAPLKIPVGAPQRFIPFRELSVSEFRSWSELSALMAPHYAKAATLRPDSPLKAEVAKIRAASSDPKVQAAAALRLVEDQVRYLALVLNLGGYIPAEADQTWARRYGDCKAKTVLLMALLHELGIEAEAALVHSARGDGLNERLPALGDFDHVIVRAVVGGKVYWLDGTRTGDRSLDTLGVPPFFWALPLRERDAALVALLQPPLTAPDSFMRLRIDASAGLDTPAATHGEMTLSPAMSAMLAMGAANLPGVDRDKLLRAMWAAYPWIDIKTLTTVQGDDGSMRVTIDGTSRLPFERQAIGRAFRIRGADLGPVSLAARDADSPFPDAPYAVSSHPGYKAFSLAITLPKGGDGFVFEAPDVDVKIAGRAFTRKARIAKGVATIEATERTLVREIPAAEARSAKAQLEAVTKVSVVLRAPGNYQPTDQDLAALRTQAPTTASAYIERGDRYMQSGRNELAMADFNKAVELDPKSTFAYSNRALGHIYGGRMDAAKADIVKAQDLDPRNHVALHAVGLIAMREGRYADAAAAFGRAADLRAGNTFALTAQAGAYTAMGDTEKALAAVADLERIVPDRNETKLLRARIYMDAGAYAKALEEVDRALATTPEDASLLLTRATLLGQMGRREDADRAIARALEIKPSVEAYLTRAVRRAPSDVAGKLADIAAAEKLEPGLVVTAARRADALGDAGRYDEAMSTLAVALKAHPDDESLLFARADIHARAGRTPLAIKDFAAIRAKAGGAANSLNGLCWQQAIRNVALDAALVDCDAALKLSPAHANALDSRAFVLMRLGRLEEALVAYDAALKARPRQAESLFGRALTRLRLNQTALGQADLAAARAVDPQIDATFAGYGLTAPDARTAAGASGQPST